MEQETKFSITDINKTIGSIRNVAKVIGTECIRDTIWGAKSSPKKIRMRVVDNLEYHAIEVIYKYKIASEGGIKTEVEEMIYRGSDMSDAVSSIKDQGDFKEENSYEKTRISFESTTTKITLDIYPYGVWMEIEGEIEEIWKTAKKLGFGKNDAVTDNADELYLSWAKSKKLPIQWDIRFGLTGKK